LFGQQRRVAKRVTAHQHADANALSARGEARKQRPALEVGPRRTTGLDVMVTVPGAVETEPFEQLPALDQLGERLVLIGHQTKARQGGGQGYRDGTLPPATFLVPSLRSRAGCGAVSPRTSPTVARQTPARNSSHGNGPGRTR